jgi:hypothetical protein
MRAKSGHSQLEPDETKAKRDGFAALFTVEEATTYNDITESIRALKVLRILTRPRSSKINTELGVSFPRSIECVLRSMS